MNKAYNQGNIKEQAKSRNIPKIPSKIIVKGKIQSGYDTAIKEHITVIDDKNMCICGHSYRFHARAEYHVLKSTHCTTMGCQCKKYKEAPK